MSVGESTPLGTGKPTTSTRYVFPVQGYRGDIPLHHGSSNKAADLFGQIGTPILAMTAGAVTGVSSDGLGGNTCTYIGATDGRTYYNAHMRDKALVSVGSIVRAGQPIGVLGDTGNAKGTTPHLHIGIGYGIISGSGPDGGGGIGFDTTKFLREVLANGGVVNGEYTDTGSSGSTGSSGDTGLNATPGYALIVAILRAVASLWSGGKNGQDTTT